jgi:DNA-binding beta-propeller fold protein YncE
MRRLRFLALVTVMLAGCGGAHDRTPKPRLVAAGAPIPASAHRHHTRPAPTPSPKALVTDEDQNLVAIVDLRSGLAREFIGVARGPQYVAAEPGVALVTSPAAGAVSLLEGSPLRVVKVFGGFGTPRAVAISPDGQHVYVTDDARGTLTVIRLGDNRVTSTLAVGAGAHHMASNPNQSRLWIALTEAARTIVIVDTSDIDHPFVLSRFDPGFPAHDLAFSPDGTRVWISSARGPDVAVLRAGDHRLLFRVPVGPPPQHIALAGPYAYLTSGYGSTLEQVSARTGAVIRRVSAPYGSFEVAAADGYVATASLLDGHVAIYTPDLKLLKVLGIGPATRDVDISDQ